MVMGPFPPNRPRRDGAAIRLAIPCGVLSWQGRTGSSPDLVGTPRWAEGSAAIEQMFDQNGVPHVGLG